MTRRGLLYAGIGGAVAWIAIHGGLLLAGGVISVAVIGGHGSERLRCEEDEVAIHGGLDDWYDKDLPLECVNFEEFPEVTTYDEGYDAGFSDGFKEGYDKGRTGIGEPRSGNWRRSDE